MGSPVRAPVASRLELGQVRAIVQRHVKAASVTGLGEKEKPGIPPQVKNLPPGLFQLREKHRIGMVEQPLNIGFLFKTTIPKLGEHRVFAKMSEQEAEVLIKELVDLAIASVQRARQIKQEGGDHRAYFSHVLGFFTEDLIHYSTWIKTKKDVGEIVAFKSGIRSEDADVRVAAIKRAGKIGMAEAIEDLREIEKKSSGAESLAAGEALELLGDKGVLGPLDFKVLRSFYTVPNPLSVTYMKEENTENIWSAGICGKYVIVANSLKDAKRGYVLIFDISDPEHPRKVCKMENEDIYSLMGFAGSIEISASNGRFATVDQDGKRVKLFEFPDRSKPGTEQPRLIYVISTDKGEINAAVGIDGLICARSNANVITIDNHPFNDLNKPVRLSDSTNFINVRNYYWVHQVLPIKKGDVLAIKTGDNKEYSNCCILYDQKNKKPIYQIRYKRIFSIAVSGNKLAILGYGGEGRTVLIMDVTSPDNPKVISQINAKDAHAIAMDGDILIVHGDKTYIYKLDEIDGLKMWTQTTRERLKIIMDNSAAERERMAELSSYIVSDEADLNILLHILQETGSENVAITAAKAARDMLQAVRVYKASEDLTYAAEVKEAIAAIPSMLQTRINALTAKGANEATIAMMMKLEEAKKYTPKKEEEKAA